jgi:hypothetical protein
VQVAHCGVEVLVAHDFLDGPYVGAGVQAMGVMTAYGTAAAASSTLAAFGALQFWWLGEHGSPRIDTSEHVFFANDQLATRFIEEIDFDYAAVDAMATLATPAA